MLPRKSWRNPRASPSTRFQMEMLADDCVRNEFAWLTSPSLVIERRITIFGGLFQPPDAPTDSAQPAGMAGYNWHTVHGFGVLLVECKGLRPAWCDRQGGRTPPDASGHHVRRQSILCARLGHATLVTMVTGRRSHATRMSRRPRPPRTMIASSRAGSCSTTGRGS